MKKALKNVRAKKTMALPHGSIEPLPLERKPVVSKMKPIRRAFGLVARHKKYWLPLLTVVLVLVVYWQMPLSWLTRSLLGNASTYPDATVLGVNVGNLDANQLEAKIAQIKSDFETKNFTLTSGDKSWTYSYGQLGVGFDDQATVRAVLGLNSVSLIDKYKLLFGNTSPSVMPAVSVDDGICVKALASISILPTTPKDASVYFDQAAKIRADRPGTKYSAATNCKELPNWLANGMSTADVKLDTVPANLTEADLKPKLAEIKAVVDKPLTLHSKSYQRVISSEQLLSLLTISKGKSGVQVGWNQTKLDELVADVSSHVNTYDPVPALETCQYMVNSGGSWLDRTATKKYIQNLNAESARTYDLPMAHYDQVIGRRSSVPRGNSGTVYLTFDDGMNYADRIMDYAACYGVKVTFFEIGSIAAGQAASLRRAIAEGHAVQSHGYIHALYDYGRRGYDWQYNDIKQSIDAITAVTGVRPTYFRPPGGNRSDSTYQAASANKVNLILWGDSSRDGSPTTLSSGTVCANVLAGIYPGVSVLMHSTHYTTAEAVPCIIEGLAARGYNMQALR